jgi:hypothetical protein
MSENKNKLNGQITGLFWPKILFGSHFGASFHFFPRLTL